MYILKAILRWGWCPILIVALAITGFIYEWPLIAVAPGLIGILVIGLAIIITGAREREFKLISSQHKQLVEHFSRRFMGNSSISIFAIINHIFGVDDPKLWEWAQACDTSQRILDAWCDSFISRMKRDVKTREFTVCLCNYTNELWLLNNFYFEFVEQFCELAGKVELPREAIDQYSKFVVEYNAFVQHFRENVAKLRKMAEVEIEPPSVRFASELLGIK